VGIWRALRELSVSFAGADVQRSYTVIWLRQSTGWLSGAAPCPARP